MKQIIIKSERDKTYAINLIKEMPLDGSGTVITKKTDVSSTAKQMKLRFMWMGEIANSGLGQHDTKDGVDLACKYKFGVPILKRDDDCFAIVYKHYMEAIEGYSNNSSLIRQFVEDYVSISKLMNKKQHSEYLSDIQNFWNRKGIGLTDPSLLGLDKVFKLLKKS